LFEHDCRRQWVCGASQKATKHNLSVIGVPKEPVGEAAALLARCYRANPDFVDPFPDERVSDGWLHDPSSTARGRLLPRLKKGAASEGEDPP
jgi:hypothetical protein